MDLERVRARVRQFSELLEDAERPIALEALILKAGFGR